MKKSLNKLIISLTIAVALPAAALAADVDLQLLVNPAAGTSGGAGSSSSSGGGESNILSNRQTRVVSGWTSPGAYVEALIGNQVAGTAVAASDGSFSINAEVDGVKYMTVRSTDVFGNTTPSSDPIDISIIPGAITGIILPPTLSLPSTTIATGATISASGRTIPGAIVSVVLTAANGKTVTAFPVVGAGGDYNISLNTKGLPDGAFTLQISANFGGKTATTIITETIGKIAPVLPVGCNGTSDLNCDNKVSLQDVSILLKYFGTKQFPAAYDLNHDGKINLVDLSIMLYYLSRPARTALTIAMVESTTGPNPPTVIFDVGQNTDGEWLAAFSATSENNEIKSTEISIDSGRTWRPAESPYQLGLSKPTNLMLRASDAAGDTTIVQYRSRTATQMIIALLSGVLVAAALIIILNLISRRRAR